jgi:hypothetical protein
MSDDGEFPFSLPHGYVDGEGRMHKEGSMRLARARDEVEAMSDHRVKSNPSYLAVILLARVVTRLGSLTQIHPRMVEELRVADFAFLQEMYRRINEQGHNRIRVTCPACEQVFDVEVQPSGEA